MRADDPILVEDAFDPRSEDARRDPYPHYRRLRDQHAVSFLKCMQWVAVTRHADVARVLRSPGEFSSTIMRSADHTLLGQDPPAHTGVRARVAQAFDAPRIRALVPRIGLTARALVRGFVAAGGGDFVREIAVELPVRIIAHMLGIEDDRLTSFKQWSESVIMAASRMIPAGRQAELARHVADFDRCFVDLIERRRRQPGDDVVSALLQSSDAAALCDGDVRSLAKLLLIAGNETTTNLMSNAMLALLTTPGLQQRLRDQPWLCRAWIDETLRFDAPVQILLRRANDAVEIGGTRIPKGATVAAFLGSANRDERQHHVPDSFVLERREPHLAFGAGPHFCLGAWLARLEATIGLSVLVAETRHVEALEDLAQLPRIAALQLRGPQRIFMAAVSSSG